MQQVHEYRKHADECRALASKAMNADHRQRLLGLAAQWDALAEDREKLLKTQNRLRDP
jgi:hypothetical protein